MKIVLTNLLPALLVITSCSPGSKTKNPFGASVPCTVYINESYVTSQPFCGDPTPEQVFDLYIPQVSLPGNAPKPLIIYIHGGGLTGGKKEDISTNAQLAPEVAKILEKGWAFISINHRLLSTNCASETCGVRDKCFDDVVRFIKFIKSHAGTYKIDKDKIGIFGTSAGGSLATLLAFKGFETKITPTQFDPTTDGISLDAENTAVDALVVIISQASFDIFKWDTKVFTGNYGTADLGVIQIRDSLNSNDDCYVHKMYGMGNIFPTPLTPIGTADYRKDVDILKKIENINTGFPEFLIINFNDKDDLANPFAKTINHHPLQGVCLADQALANSNLTGHLFYDIPLISVPAPPPAGTYVQNGGYTSIAEFFFDKVN